ncbi:MAG: hypothetical protein JOY92_11110 [Verrucomicrobia bacterium]|nr:hypothetical protein [Verrucomicrobiota bacterium]
MRGAPLVEALVALVALLSLAVPIRDLTLRSRSKLAPVIQAAPAKSVRLELVGTAPSFEFNVSYLGQALWSGTGHQSPSHADFQLPLPKEGIDLEVSARFPDSNLHALRLTVSTGDGVGIERSAWGTDALDEVLTFQPAI